MIQPVPSRWSQRAFTIVNTIDDFALQIQVNHYFGSANFNLGNYDEAMSFLTKNVESLVGDQIYKRFGLAFLASLELVPVGATLIGAWSVRRSYLSWVTKRSVSRRRLITLLVSDTAYFAIGYVQLRKGAIDKAISYLERSMGNSVRPGAFNRIFYA